MPSAKFLFLQAANANDVALIVEVDVTLAVLVTVTVGGAWVTVDSSVDTTTEKAVMYEVPE